MNDDYTESDHDRLIDNVEIYDDDDDDDDYNLNVDPDYDSDDHYSICDCPSLLEPTTSRSDASAIRDWAKTQSLPAPDKGPLPKQTQAAYKEAHPDV